MDDMGVFGLYTYCFALVQLIIIMYGVLQCIHLIGSA